MAPKVHPHDHTHPHAREPSIHRRLPPYAKHVEPKTPEIWVLTGARAWERARFRVHHRLPVVVVPPGEAPDGFRWHFIRDRDILLVDLGSSDDWLEGLAHLLLTAGATKVVVVHGAQVQLAVFTREVPNATP